jgi:hypothetical protein
VFSDLYSHTNSDSEWENESFVQKISPWKKSGGTFFSNSGPRNKTTHTEFRNLKILIFIQSLKFEGLLRIVCNMWELFTHATCASNFLIASFHV